MLKRVKTVKNELSSDLAEYSLMGAEFTSKRMMLYMVEFNPLQMKWRCLAIICIIP